MLMIFALCTASAKEPKCLLDNFSAACKDFGLTVSLNKTVVLSESSDNADSWIDNTAFGVVYKFKYLGATLDKKVFLDDKLSIGLEIASTTFGRLTNHM